MDLFFKKISESILYGGTVGGYAVFSIILMIYGYFKYLKPFLDDFYKMKGNIENNKDIDEMKLLLKELKEEIRSNFSTLKKEHNDFKYERDKIIQENKEDLEKIILELKNDIKNIQKDFDRFSTIDSQIRNKILEKLTLTQSKIEMLLPLERNITGMIK